MAEVVGSDGWSWKWPDGLLFVIPHLQRDGKEGPVTESLYIYICVFFFFFKVFFWVASSPSSIACRVT